jgi:hypothetical protein
MSGLGSESLWPGVGPSSTTIFARPGRTRPAVMTACISRAERMTAPVSRYSGNTSRRGRIGVGLALGFQWHAEEAYFQLPAIRWTEIQIDPRIRIFLATSGWLRPFIRLAAGFSVALPGGLLSEDISYKLDHGFSVNASATVGLMVAPNSLPAAFSLELGPEFVFLWANGEREDGATRGYSGNIRHLLLTFSAFY